MLRNGKRKAMAEAAAQAVVEGRQGWAVTGPYRTAPPASPVLDGMALDIQTAVRTAILAEWAAREDAADIVLGYIGRWNLARCEWVMRDGNEYDATWGWSRRIDLLVDDVCVWRLRWVEQRRHVYQLVTCWRVMPWEIRCVRRPHDGEARGELV